MIDFNHKEIKDTPRVRVSLDLVQARRQSLARLLEQHRYLPIANLCERLGVSEATARRDLVALEREKRITRTYGGALGPLDDYNQGFASFEERRRRAAASKLKIAHAARKLLRPGSTVFLDAGTTLFTLATLLREQPVGPLICVTNSLPIAEALGGQPQVEVHLLGGFFLDRQSILLGPGACAAVERWSFDASFLGAEGVSSEGVWNSSPGVIEFQRAILRRSAVSRLCLDMLKIGHTTPHLLADWTEPWRLLTSAKGPRLTATGIPAKLQRDRIDFA